MTRQLDTAREKREGKRRDRLVYALEYGIVEALEASGIELLGYAFRYDAFNCLMTIKGVVGGEKQVAFVGSDSVMNCILKSYSDANTGNLTWRADRYHQKQV